MKKVALITGASTGLGKEFAHIHAEKGGDLVIVARREEKLTALKTLLEEKYGIDVVVISKDLSLANAAQDIYDQVKKQGINIEYLINNAGFGGIGEFYKRELSADLSMINLNIVALTSLTRLFLTDFVSENQGKILNVSSTASLLPGPMQAVYFATKAYVTSFSNAIAEELSDTNITVTNLMPGATATEFGEVSGMDKTPMFQKTASARKVALDGYEAMMKGRLDIISGLTFMQKIMMASIPFTPKKILLKQIKKMQNG